MAIDPEGTPVQTDQPHEPDSPMDEADRRPDLTAEQAPERLGFIETQEMLALRAELIEAIRAKDPQTGQALVAEWQALGERIVSEQPHDEGRQLGYHIAFALMRKEAGRPYVYADELYHGPIDYLAQPRYNRYPEIAALLEAEFAEFKRPDAEQ